MTNKPWETDQIRDAIKDGKLTRDPSVIWQVAQFEAARALYEYIIRPPETFSEKHFTNPSTMVVLRVCDLEKLLWPEGRKTDGT